MTVIRLKQEDKVTLKQDKIDLSKYLLSDVEIVNLKDEDIKEYLKKITEILRLLLR